MSSFLCRYASAENSDNKTDASGRSSNSRECFQSKILVPGSKIKVKLKHDMALVYPLARGYKHHSFLCAEIMPSCGAAGAVLHSSCFVHRNENKPL